MTALAPLLRGPAPIRPREALRAGLGALVGVGLCGLMARLLSEGELSAAPLLVAPIGASAVLAFAVPASPLAQPRAVIGGNVMAALVGVTCALLIPNPALAAAAAVGCAILAMALTGCLHPPGGAVALGAALAAEPLGYDYALAPVGLCSVLLVLLASAYGRLTGRSYPHRTAPAASVHNTRDPPADQRVGYTPADLDAALARYGELLDVGRDDLDALFREVERQAHGRLHAQILCRDIMSRDIIFLRADEDAGSALSRLQAHELRTAPVLDASGRLVGMARRAELLAAGDGPVTAALDPAAQTVGPQTPIHALLPVLSRGAIHEAMVVDEDRRLLGVITQTDLLAVLYRAHVVETAISARAA